MQTTHTSLLLYSRAFDFPRRFGAPLKQLMIAAVPRSGSTAFCLELWRTGMLGAPLEYLNSEFVSRETRWRKLQRGDVKCWKELQCVRTATNGVFSYKFFVHDYVEILNRRPRLLPYIAPTHVVYFTRADKLSQAISYSRAIRSGAWFANANTRNKCEYDSVHI